MDVDEVIESALHLAASAVRARARITLGLAAGAPALASEGRLGQVFLNLLVNAAQAIPDDDPEANEVRVTSRTDTDGTIVAEVRDTGVGISPEVRDRLFEPFVTTKASGAGTGLGLFICRNLVREMGGEIQIEPAPERGTIVRVRLRPAAQVPAR